MKVDLNKVIPIQWIGGMGKKGTIGMLDIINWGLPFGEDSIKFITKNGEIIKKLTDFNDNYTTLIKIEDIDIKDSLGWWYRNHQGEYGKPLILDDTLEVGERYFGNSWRIGLILSASETEVRYNFIFPE
jgi:hypothetical protein